METGSFSEAAVEGLMSCLGEGARLIWAVCIVSAISMGREDSISMSSDAATAGGSMRAK